MQAGKEVILIPRRQSKTERHERKMKKIQESRHKQRKTGKRDWKRKRAVNRERMTIETYSKEGRVK